MFTKTDVERWVETKRKLDQLKEQELELRNKITPLVLQGKPVGSKTAVIDGIKLRATARLNYTLDIAELSLIDESLSDTERACIEWKPVVKESAYNKLPDDSVLRRAVTVKPGQAGLVVA